MFFRVSGDVISLSDGDVEVSLTREQFAKLENRFVLPSEGVTEVWNLQQHYIIEDGNQQEAPEELKDRELFASRAALYKAASHIVDVLPVKGENAVDWESLIGEVNRGRGQGFLLRVIMEGKNPNAFTYLTGVMNNYAGRQPSDLYQALNLLFLSFQLTEEETGLLRDIMDDCGFDPEQVHALKLPVIGT